VSASSGSQSDWQGAKVNGIKEGNQEEKTSIVIVFALTVGVMNVSAQERQHQHGEKKPPAKDAKKDAHQHGSMDMNKRGCK
jgi:hypothetical protein